MSRPRTELHPLYDRVTDAIIADLERGVLPWTKPWSAGSSQGACRPLRHSGEPYRGINVVLLWSEAAAKGFASPTWMTFRQALALGGHVQKGEHGATVVYADRITRTEADETGEETVSSIPFLKAYTVFNVDQIDGLPERFTGIAARPEPPARIAAAEAFIDALGADIRHGGDSAYYAPASDHIRMPRLEQFLDAESYYATLLHELTHWTGHEQRLDRRHASAPPDDRYAREELVAELGAAFLCADIGLTLTPRDDHASYLAHWLKVLRNDRRAIFTAAAQAQRAVEFLTGQDPASD
jgi:antirestriction protein ArdC